MTPQRQEPDISSTIHDISTTDEEGGEEEEDNEEKENVHNNKTASAMAMITVSCRSV